MASLYWHSTPLNYPSRSAGLTGLPNKPAIIRQKVRSNFVEEIAPEVQGRADVTAAGCSSCGASLRVLRVQRSLSCILLVVMQKASQRLNWTENADNADEAEFDQAAYFL
jgi:hypothetical protein